MAPEDLTSCRMELSNIGTVEVRPEQITSKTSIEVTFDGGTRLKCFQS